MLVKIVKMTPEGLKDIVVKPGTCVKALPGETFVVRVLINFKTPIEVLTDVTKVAVGYSHCVAIKKENQLYGIGNNYKGQLGLDEVINAHGWVYLNESVVDICASMLTTKIVTTEGYVKCSGDFSKDMPMLGMIKKFKIILDSDKCLDTIYKVA